MSVATLLSPSAASLMSRVISRSNSNDSREPGLGDEINTDSVRKLNEDLRSVIYNAKHDGLNATTVKDLKRVGGRAKLFYEFHGGRNPSHIAAAHWTLMVELMRKVEIMLGGKLDPYYEEKIGDLSSIASAVLQINRQGSAANIRDAINQGVNDEVGTDLPRDAGWGEVGTDLPIDVGWGQDVGAPGFFQRYKTHIVIGGGLVLVGVIGFAIYKGAKG